MRVGIIGTAGRGDNFYRLTPDLYNRAIQWVRLIVDPLPHPLVLVSGGAAWMDHIAVILFRQIPSQLELHLPAPFVDGQYVSTRDGEISNHYHRKFSAKIGGDSLLGIQGVLPDATVYTYPGFFARNNGVAQVDTLIALTFGTRSGVYGPDVDARAAGLQDGGTAHTWNACKASLKYHLNLFDLGTREAT